MYAKEINSNNPFENNNNSSMGSSPSPIKQMQRSSDFKQEIQQRKSAMDNYYFISYKFKYNFYWYFILFICICVILIMIIGSLTFDKIIK